MAIFWKFKAWLHHWVTKIFWLLTIAALFLIGYYLRGPIAAVWHSIDRAMG